MAIGAEREGESPEITILNNVTEVADLTKGLPLQVDADHPLTRILQNAFDSGINGKEIIDALIKGLGYN
jgi:hypothetical protein